MDIMHKSVTCFKTLGPKYTSKHRENRKTLPFENLFVCQYVKVVFTKNCHYYYCHYYYCHNYYCHYYYCCDNVIHIFAVADDSRSFVPRDYSRLRTEKSDTPGCLAQSNSSPT